MTAYMKITESSGVVRINGKPHYNVMVCTHCGACATITIKQGRNGQAWLTYLAEVLDCCSSPDYYYGDFLGFYDNDKVGGKK